MGGPALAAAFHASLEDSAAAHFQGNSVINCMCGSTGARLRAAASLAWRSWPAAAGVCMVDSNCMG